jgi:GNAT superfamily N-acetyltransferase
MITRFATDRDTAELVRVINLAYRVEDFFVNGNRTNPDDIRTRLAMPDSGFIVIDDEEKGVLAGAVWVDLHGTRGHFGMLSVDPAYQGKGLSRTLINAVEDHCRSKGCTDLDLEVVNLRLELPPYYAKFGFSPSGTTEFNDTKKLTREVHLIVMTKPLSTPAMNAR